MALLLMGADRDVGADRSISGRLANVRGDIASRRCGCGRLVESIPVHAAAAGTGLRADPAADLHAHIGAGHAAEAGSVSTAALRLTQRPGLALQFGRLG